MHSLNTDFKFKINYSHLRAKVSYAFLALLLQFSLAFPAFAQMGSGKDLNTSVLSSDIRFECSSKQLNAWAQRLGVDLKKFALESIESGLGELLQLNPHFQNLVDSKKNKPLIITCDLSHEKAAAHFNEKYPLTLNYILFQLNFGTKKGHIHIGKPLLAYLAMMDGRRRMKDSYFDLYHPPRKNTKKTPIPYSVNLTARRINDVQDSIFHEYLHYLGSDNLDLKKHNKPEGIFGGLYFEDVVYSCTATTHRYGKSLGLKNYNGKIGKRTIPGLYKMAWLLSCKTCLSARYTNGKYDPALVDKRNYEDYVYADKKCNDLFYGIPNLIADF